MKIIRCLSVFLLVITLSGCKEIRKTQENDKKELSAEDIHEVLILLKKADTDTRKNYVEKIKNMGASAINPLISELSSDDAEIQESAAALLGIIGDSTAFVPLINGLQGGIKRKYIVPWALAKLHDSRAIPHLIKTLGNNDPEVRIYTIKALISFGYEAINPLLEAIKSQDPFVRAGAVTALGDIAGSEAFNPIVSLVNDKNEDVLLAVSHVMGKIGSDLAIEPLVKFLKHKNKNIRINAVRSLGIIGNIGYRNKNILENVLIDDNEMEVRELTARVLENITGTKYKYKNDKGEMVFPKNIDK
ncbi:HEAT repeat domain-containing protein [Candidatus Desantisbacteria bacterium]|nr:HEAT repeat domain-containing protein [Candidatus Desantisbacteria bacterium]